VSDIIGFSAYMVVFLFTFFAASFIVSRYSYDHPTDPPIFLLLTGGSLIWPITVPLAVLILLLLGIAELAVRLAGGAK
jgi:hypothetical protein